MNSAPKTTAAHSASDTQAASLLFPSGSLDKATLRRTVS